MIGITTNGNGTRCIIVNGTITRSIGNDGNVMIGYNGINDTGAIVY